MLKKSDGIDKNINGFSLIELMVVITLISILSLIAYPNFLSYIKSYHMTTAENDMYEIAFRLEKVKNKQFSYKTALEGNGKLKDDIHVSYSPKQGPIRYNFTFDIQDTMYKITATPTELQGEAMGKFILTYDGEKFEKKWDSLNNNTYNQDW